MEYKTAGNEDLEPVNYGKESGWLAMWNEANRVQLEGRRRGTLRGRWGDVDLNLVPLVESMRILLCKRRVPWNAYEGDLIAI